MKIGLFYGSDTGNTEAVAETMRSEIGEHIVDVHEVFNIDLSEVIKKYDFIILGVPTWYDGEIQSEWADKIDDFSDIDLTGYKVAVYGLGDQEGWGEYFCDAIAELAIKAQQSGAMIIGHWPSKGYDFIASKALVDDETFIGLTLDDDRQADLSENRIKTWLEQLKRELGVVRWDEELL